MGLWRRLRDFVTLADLPANRALGEALELREAIGAAVIPYQSGKPQWPRKEVARFSTDAYEKLALVFRCIQYVASAAATAPLLVFDESADKVVPDHPLRQLLRRPNPQSWESRYWYNVALRCLIAGFCVVEKERSDAGRPVALWPLRPDWLKPILRNQRPPDWEYRIPGERDARILTGSGDRPSDPGDVLVYTYADLPDGWPCGIGPVEVLFREVGIQNQMTDFLKAFFDGGAVPQQLVIPDLQPGQTLTQAEKDAFRAAFMQKYGGLSRAWAPLFAGGIKSVERIGFDFDELAWTDLRDLSDLAICQAFGLHPSMVATRAGLEHSDSRANAAEARRGFYEDTVVPLWDRLDGVTTIGLLPEFDERPNIALRFDASDVPALQENRNDRAGWVVQATLGGALSVHAMHRELGLPEPEGDDFYLRTLAQSAVPADDPLEERTPKPTPPAIPPPNGVAPDEGDEEGRSVLDGLRIVVSEAIPPGTVLALPGPVRAGELVEDYAKRAAVLTLNGHGPAERRAAIGATNRQHINRLADRTAPLYRRFWREQGGRMVAAATRSAKVLYSDSWRNDPYVVRAGHEPTGPPQPVIGFGDWDEPETRDVADIDWDEETRRLLEVLTRHHQLAAQSAFAAAGDALGVSIAFDLANPNLRRVIDRLAGRVVGISNETRQDVARVVTDALDEGVTLDELSARLRGLFTETYKNRAMTVARTESQVAFNSASAVGYRETGLVDRCALLDNPAHDTDPGDDGLTCAERNGLVVPLSEVDIHIAAEHPNGTLAVSPVLTGEA